MFFRRRCCRRCRRLLVGGFFKDFAGRDFKESDIALVNSEKNIEAVRFFIESGDLKIKTSYLHCFLIQFQ